MLCASICIISLVIAVCNSSTVLYAMNLSSLLLYGILFTNSNLNCSISAAKYSAFGCGHTMDSSDDDMDNSLMFICAAIFCILVATSAIFLSFRLLMIMSTPVIDFVSII